MPRFREDMTLEFLEGKAVIEGTTLKGVKMVGLSSPTRNREYLEAGLAAAVGLYEGTTVNCGHLKPVGNREAGDTSAIMGSFSGVQMVEGKGLFGDLTLIPSHPMTERMVWAAENAPSLFCMSHHAGGKGQTNSSGIQVIEEITSVLSVDVVGDGGTTKSLFESHEDPKDISEGEIREKIDEVEKLREIRKINWTAQDLIWEKLFDGDVKPADRRDMIVEVLNDWVEELEGLTTVEESEMDLKKLKIEELRESRPDLVEALLQGNSDKDRLKLLETENKEFKDKEDARTAADALKALTETRKTAIEEAKLPDVLKTERFMEQALDASTTDERFAAMLEDRKGLIESVKTDGSRRPGAPTSSAKKLFEEKDAGKGKDGKKATTEEFVEALSA